MKSLNLIFRKMILIMLFLIISCGVEHLTLSGNSDKIINESGSYEIEAKAGKTIELNYDLSINSGSVIFLIQDINNDTLLHQTHKRDLKGTYYITKSDTNNYVGKVIVKDFIGNYDIRCKSK